MNPLHALAQACGLAREWRDVDGRDQEVDDAALAAILAALGHETASEAQITRSLSVVQDATQSHPAMLVTDVGARTPLPFAAHSVQLTNEAGKTRTLAVEGNTLPPILDPGYYDLAIDEQFMKLAVAPKHCPLPKAHGRRPWGVSLQIPSLRGESERAFGNFAELKQAATALARRGADAIAINPVHALFPGNGVGFSPYSPSSRLFLNSAMGDPSLAGLAPLTAAEAEAMIDWEAALPDRLRQLRKVFDALEPAKRAAVKAEMLQEGEALHRHALFDALDCQFRPGGAHGWRDWPAPYRDPSSAAVAQFAAENQTEIEFHVFLQWLARKGQEAAQTAALDAGMAIGLIADLAVGVDPSGSDAWAMRDAMLNRLTIGAPPDPLGPLGQNWSITSFSPDGLRRSGNEPWIAMLRNAFASCGGLRIDHAFGLARLWVIPEGGTSADGAYLNYPFEDLIRLATLEAHRANAIVIAEDLGTAPHGFTQAVTQRQMLGMRVMWFERAEDHGFTGAQDYEPQSVAMTGTHDTVTVAGWWTGRDLDWAEKLRRLPSDVDLNKAEEIRDWDRGLLWSTIGGGEQRPPREQADPVIDAAIAHIARTPSQLAVIPVEDLLGLEEQPNLPGTVHEHPNWRRRLDQPLDQSLSDAKVAARCEALSKVRQSDEEA